MSIPVGIDLGTTFSAIAHVNTMRKPEMIPNREGERITPSVILFEDGNPVVGTYAKNASVTDPHNVVQFVKRQMGNPDYVFLDSAEHEHSAVDLSAFVLSKLKRDAQEFLDDEINRAVITVPAYFGDVRRRSTKNAGEIAGLEVLRIINEPTAAALAYGLDRAGPGQTILVYDLGGGTFDVTVMRIEAGKIDVIATDGDHALGGFDFDNRIMEIFENTFKQQTGLSLLEDPNLMQDLREKSEAAKKTLSARTKVTQFFSAGGKSCRIELGRQQFEQAISDLLGRTETLLDIVMSDANMSWGEIDKVLLVGGSTRIPAVSEMLQRLSGKQPDISINPDECVAMGAAIEAAMLAGAPSAAGAPGAGEVSHWKPFQHTDVISHALGIVILNERGIDVNNVMIPKNTTYPARHTDTFYTVQDNQTEVEVVVLQGDDENPDYCVTVGSALLPELPPRPAGQPIEVTYEFDADQMICVRAIDVGTGRMIHTKFEPKGTMSEEEKHRRRLALAEKVKTL